LPTVPVAPMTMIFMSDVLSCLGDDGCRDDPSQPQTRV